MWEGNMMLKYCKYILQVMVQFGETESSKTLPKHESSGLITKAIQKITKEYQIQYQIFPDKLKEYRCQVSDWSVTSNTWNFFSHNEMARFSRLMYIHYSPEDFKLLFNLIDVYTLQ